LATPDRWSPWIEPYTSLSVTSQDISSSTFTDLTGCSVAFTPHVDSRASLIAHVRANSTLYAGQQLWARIVVNGVEVAFGIFDPLAINGKASISFGNTHPLAKETTYTIKLQCALSAAGATTYRINQAGTVGTARATGIDIIVMPRLHAPL
jgi:hypothetical protein